MSEYSYSLRVNVNKALPPVSSGNYVVDFCSSSDASQVPPTVALSLASFGTADIVGVAAECVNVTGTSQVTILGASKFGTSATQQLVFLQENSGHTAASIRITADDSAATSTTSMLLLKANDPAFFRCAPGIGYTARAVTTATTGTLQVTVMGD
jgi:hypothetical protein